jgi:hypothetical protein
MPRGCRRPSSNLQGSVIRNRLLPEMVRIGFDLAHRERENLGGGDDGNAVAAERLAKLGAQYPSLDLRACR